VTAAPLMSRVNGMQNMAMMLAIAEARLGDAAPTAFIEFLKEGETKEKKLGE
jgi:hypothetical protein